MGLDLYITHHASSCTNTGGGAVKLCHTTKVHHHLTSGTFPLGSFMTSPSAPLSQNVKVKGGFCTCSAIYVNMYMGAAVLLRVFPCKSSATVSGKTSCFE